MKQPKVNAFLLIEPVMTAEAGVLMDEQLKTELSFISTKGIFLKIKTGRCFFDESQPITCIVHFFSLSLAR